MLGPTGCGPWDEVRSFLDGAEPVEVQPLDRGARDEFVARTLRRFRYGHLGKADKGVVRRFLVKVSGLSRAQLTRLIAQYRSTERIDDRRGPPRRPFPRRYTGQDIRLLAQVDALHGTVSGPATRKLCERAYTVFHDPRGPSGSRGSPTVICTTFAAPRPTSANAARSSPPGPPRSRSASGAGPILKAVPGSCASIRSTKATSTNARCRCPEAARPYVAVGRGAGREPARGTWPLRCLRRGLRPRSGRPCGPSSMRRPASLPWSTRRVG